LVDVISASEYSKRRGVTLTAIQRAIDDGRIARAVRRHGKGYLIDPEMADAELAANNDPTRGGKREKGIGVASEDADAPIETTSDGGETLTEAKTRHERLKADLAALELAEKEGRLVEAAAVEREAFRVARAVRDSILNIPDRVSGDLAAETDAFAIHQKLTAELRKALEGLAL
jgi:hypothetical protein